MLGLKNDIFTAELAESAEKNHIFIMFLLILPLHALRSQAQRAVNLFGMGCQDLLLERLDQTIDVIDNPKNPV